MTLLWQLTFIIDGNNDVKKFLMGIALPSTCSDLEDELRTQLTPVAETDVASLAFVNGQCNHSDKIKQGQDSMYAFFNRLRNALAHHHYKFSEGAESRYLSEVRMSLWTIDEKWMINVDGPDLHRIQLYVKKTILDQSSAGAATLAPAQLGILD